VLAFLRALVDLDLALVMVPSAACCPRPPGVPPEIWEAARFDADSVGRLGVVVLGVLDIVAVVGLERDRRWSSL
jgi:hypothetical protein